MTRLSPPRRVSRQSWGIKNLKYRGGGPSVGVSRQHLNASEATIALGCRSFASRVEVND